MLFSQDFICFFVKKVSFFIEKTGFLKKIKNFNVSFLSLKK